MRFCEDLCLLFPGLSSGWKRPVPNGIQEQGNQGRAFGLAKIVAHVDEGRNVVASFTAVWHGPVNPVAAESNAFAASVQAPYDCLSMDR